MFYDVFKYGINDCYSYQYAQHSNTQPASSRVMTAHPSSRVKCTYVLSFLMEDDGKIKHIGSILERSSKRSPVFVESIRLLPNGLRREVTRFAQRMRRRHDAVDLHVDALQFARYTLFP